MKLWAWLILGGVAWWYWQHYADGSKAFTDWVYRGVPADAPARPLTVASSGRPKRALKLMNPPASVWGVRSADLGVFPLIGGMEG